MAILSGIPLAEDVEKKVTDLAVAAMFRSLKYMFRYKSLVKDFDTKIEELNNEKEKVSRRVKEERDNGKIINEDVLKWQTDVEEIQKKDKDLSPSFRCIQCLPIPNPVSRLRLGREAVKNSEIVKALTASGKDLSDKVKEIAYLPLPSEDVPNTNTVFQEFPSRQEAFGKLWEQLVCEDPLILGIHGMPGVGKTRMMEQIWQNAQGQEKKIFSKVTLAVVGSVTFDVIKLQDQLASGLKCNLVSEDDRKSRADQLKNSMLNSGKILVIFDDVWGEISVTDIIGTSFNVASSKSDPGRPDDGNSWKGCKILFTSREKSHCVNNKCKDPVEITTLKDEEALDMFRNTLGTDQTDSPPDESLVQQVCAKCAGLPLIIHAVGKALKFKTSNLWTDALTQLEDCKIESVEGIDQKVYACLELSFDNLPKDAKQCLLLCSLLLADQFIDIDKLSDMAAGSQLVNGGEIRVRAMVDTLKSASLLLKHEGSESFRIHDIIRDVARSIAVKDHAFFIERCGWGLPGNSADYRTGKVFYLELEKDGFKFPSDLVCPELHTLWLVATNRTQQEQPCRINIPNFPGGKFSNLRFLVLENFLWQQQLYLHPLHNLKTLLVVSCNIGDTDFSSFPESLETLCIWNCVLATHLDFVKLINLRKLEIFGRNELPMVPITVSTLSCLEELHLQIPSWANSARTLMPKFNEISKLTCLKSLIIYWSDFEPCQDTSIFRELDKFDIRVGVLDREYKPELDVSATKRIELSGKLEFEGFQNLVERAEIVILRNTNVNIGRIWNSSREAFEGLRKLYIESSDTIEYLARMSPYEYEIQSIPRQWSSFSKVTYLGISGCCAMKYLFNNFVAECLMQLQELHVSNCERMEVIVTNEGTSDGNHLNFSKLKSLKLLSLPNLKSFYEEKKNVHLNSAFPFAQPQPLFDGMVAFPSLEVLEINNLDATLSDIWGKNYYNNDNVSSFSKLKSLKISMCAGLKNVFQHSSLASHLIMHLKKMNIRSCKMMTEIGTGEQKEIVFPELTKLKLIGLPNLNSFWCCQSGEANTYKVKLPALVTFKLKDVEINLEPIKFGRDNFTCQLEYLTLSCNKEIQLPSEWQLPLYDLERLTLRHCLSDVLKSLCFFRRLKFLKVTELECHTLFSLSVLVSLQQLQVLDISNCSMLKELVEDARGEEVSGTDKKTITLFHLEAILLQDLPNLKSLIQGANYELHLPALVNVNVANCGLSMLFTCSAFQKLNFLKELSVFRCILLEGIVADTMETSDANDKIITLPQLSSVKLGDLPNLKSFIHSANYELRMPALKFVEVANCGLSTLFTCTIFQNLRQLRYLQVNKCELLEGIVAGDERGIETFESNDKIITLPQLSSVALGDLPNLKSLIQGANYELHLPALVHVSVANCGLSTLFTCSAFQKLNSLQKLSVYSCKLLEGIVADTRDIETFESNDKIITLPQLSSVTLADLPNLKSFSLAVSYAFNMPQLRYLNLQRCPRMEYFTPLKASTGSVLVFFEGPHGKDVLDLNDYIRQQCKRPDSAEHQPPKRTDSAKHQPLEVSLLSFAWSCPWAC